MAKECEHVLEDSHTTVYFPSDRLQFSDHPPEVVGVRWYRQSVEDKTKTSPTKPRSPEWTKDGYRDCGTRQILRHIRLETLKRSAELKHLIEQCLADAALNIDEPNPGFVEVSLVGHGWCAEGDDWLLHQDATVPP